MFVSINLNTLKICHKHKYLETVADLAYIEMNNEDYLIASYDAKYVFSMFTDKELQLIWENSTGEALHEERDVMLIALSNLLALWPETDCNMWEVEQQARKLNGNHTGLVYVKGSTMAGRKPDLYIKP